MSDVSVGEANELDVLFADYHAGQQSKPKFRQSFSLGLVIKSLLSLFSKLFNVLAGGLVGFVGVASYAGSAETLSDLFALFFLYVGALVVGVFCMLLVLGVYAVLKREVLVSVFVGFGAAGHLASVVVSGSASFVRVSLLLLTVNGLYVLNEMFNSKE